MNDTTELVLSSGGNLSM